MKLFYVWITDSSADDGRRAWIIKAANDFEARLAAPTNGNESLTDIHARELFKDRSKRIERI